MVRPDPEQHGRCAQSPGRAETSPGEVRGGICSLRGAMCTASAPSGDAVMGVRVTPDGHDATLARMAPPSGVLVWACMGV